MRSDPLVVSGAALGASMAGESSDLYDLWFNDDIAVPEPSPRERVGKSGAAQHKRAARKRKNVRARSKK